MKHGAEGSDACAGRDEDRITHGRPQDEIAERPLTANLVAFFHIAEKVRHEPVLYTVEAECEARVFAWRRGDGVSAGEFLSIGPDLFERQPLTGHKSKAPHAGHLELKVFRKLGERRGTHQLRDVSLKGSH